MNFYVAWVIFCIFSASFIFGFRKEKVEGNREYNIDGLRYLLASLVVFHHHGYSENLVKVGVWGSSDPALAYAGTFGVAVFFMITGYLFGEIKKDTNWISFFIKRIFRIVPMCYVSSVACIVIAAYIGINNAWKINFNDFIYWFDGGVSGVRPVLFGYKYTNQINAGVTWTLYWEWVFYLSLPIISLLFNKRFTIGICISIIAVLINLSDYLKIPNLNSSFLLFFAIGILIRNIKSQYNYKTSSILTNSLAVAIMLYCIFLSNKHMAYNVLSALLIGVFFFFIASGVNLFGFITSKGSVLLGDASYSLYLTHGIGWFIMHKITIHYGVNENLIVYYVLQTLTWYAMCYISIKTYKYIERPFIKTGKKLSEKINTK
ncbi:acyltransferase family protein [Enterobacter kobei]|uniref:acyltransferase family protein n=1 Tax=Enterobacter kobei TaxID=208224 RepID=UPI00298CFD86|nr:acyltransferase [Enterobacter kobei]